MWPEALLGLQIVAVLCFAAAYHPLDLEIYRWGGRAVLHGDQLYLVQGLAHWFTYPPFAAVGFGALSAAPDVLVRVVWELGSVGACALACAITLRLGGLRASRRAVAGLLAAALMLEPVWHTLFLGQINLFLMALILLDVRRIATGRHAGLGIGIAAAVKLTPAIFIVLLILARKTRSAMIAAGTFLAGGAAGFVVAPEASWHYWSGLFLDTSRVGAPYISNQSPFGALLRLTGVGQYGSSSFGAWYLLIPLVIGAIGLSSAAVFARREDWLAAAAVTGVTGLLVSPISWTHHWIWVIPALVLLARGDTGERIAAAAAAVLFVLAPPWWTPHGGDSHEYGLHGLLSLAANSYLIAAIAFVVYQAVRALRLVTGSGLDTSTVPVRETLAVPVNDMLVNACRESVVTLGRETAGVSGDGS